MLDVLSDDYLKKITADYVKPEVKKISSFGFVKVVVIVLSSLIVVSTLFTKQHSVIDVKMALFMALLCRLLAEVIANRCGLVV